MSYDDSSTSIRLPSQPLSSSKSIASDHTLLPESSAWSTSFVDRSRCNSPRSSQSSPRSVASCALRSHWLPSSRSIDHLWGLGSILSSLLSSSERSERGVGMSQNQGVRRRKNGGWWGQQWRRNRGVVVLAGLVGFFFLANWWMFSWLQHDHSARRKDFGVILNSTLPTSLRKRLKEKQNKFAEVGRPRQVMYNRLLALAAHALADAGDKPEPRDLWKETLVPTVSWKPCADQRSWKPSEPTNGYILVSANGGISQQRVAFLYSSVWQDTSQFSDIYQEEHFINYLQGDIKIVKELPVELQSLDLEVIGSLVTDAELMKEAKLSFYVKKILRILLKNRVVHFTGFGNRLAFDPIPFDLQVSRYLMPAWFETLCMSSDSYAQGMIAQEKHLKISAIFKNRLRCRCNFHALRFVNKIQETGALLVQRMRRHISQWSLLEHNLLGPSAANSTHNAKAIHPTKASRYLAIHLRFEIDMAAYSLCYFGGGKEEVEELEAYREVHFPALNALKKTKKMPSPDFLRSEGQCPLTPEESVLMLAALGFKRKTRLYVAGADIYGGKSRMAALKSLYPNLATKESLLLPSEIEPFNNFSSQLAALDFIACSAADAFAMTDSGSQLSSLVAGYRIYYGEGKHPTIRPNKRRLVTIFAKNSTIEWKQFEIRVRKTVKQSKKVYERPVARSIYRHPRCSQCMCPVDS